METLYTDFCRRSRPEFLISCSASHNMILCVAGTARSRGLFSAETTNRTGHKGLLTASAIIHFCPFPCCDSHRSPRQRPHKGRHDDRDDTINNRCTSLIAAEWGLNSKTLESDLAHGDRWLSFCHSGPVRYDYACPVTYHGGGGWQGGRVDKYRLPSPSLLFVFQTGTKQIDKQAQTEKIIQLSSTSYPAFTEPYSPVAEFQGPVPAPMINMPLYHYVF